VAATGPDGGRPTAAPIGDAGAVLSSRSSRTPRRRAARAVAAAVALLLAASCSGGSGDDDGAAPEEPVRQVVVALGDSFSSGEGAPPYDRRPEPCRRSPGAWPRLLAERREVASVDLRACAGARTEHLIGPWARRELAPQIPTEPDTSVTLVTLTVGGNDIGFGEVVASCVVLTCFPAPGTDELEGRLEHLRQVLVQRVHPRLAAAYPNARIVHIGYPHLAPPPGVDPSCIWMSGADQRIARGIVDALNGAVEDAAQQAGTARYLDVVDAFAGHELCTDVSWVNAVGFGPGAAHPTAAGQRALAAAVADELALQAR
jgi:lysophospholipase L1-like esterase